MTSYERIEKVIRYIEAHQREQPRLETLAEVAGLSESHFARLFSKWAGTTPKDFLKYVTNEHAKRLLEDSKDVLNAAFESGLSGPGRLHDLLVTVEGVTPGEFKAKGEGVEIDYAFVDSPFGECLLAVTARGICHLAFLHEGYPRAEALRYLREAWPKAALRNDPRGTSVLSKRLFNGGGRGALSVFLRGTPFQLKVWEALLRIPEGKASTYGAIAAAIGRPKASRAVGAAVGSNPVGYLIPCHRVLRETGVLGGYRWGTPRKRAILAWEAARATR